MLLLDQNYRRVGQLRRIVMTDRATQLGIQMGVVIYARVFNWWLHVYHLFVRLVILVKPHQTWGLGPELSLDFTLFRVANVRCLRQVRIHCSQHGWLRLIVQWCKARCVVSFRNFVACKCKVDVGICACLGWSIADEWFSPPIVILGNDLFLGKTTVEIDTLLKVARWSKRGQFIRRTNWSLDVSKSLFIFVYQLVYWDSGIAGNETQRFQFLLVAGIQTLSGYDSRLLVHDALSELVVVLVDAGSFPFLGWEV